MGFMNKIKNFFYEEEEIEEEIIPKKEPKKKKEIINKNNEEVSERDLFRSERTFNFPIDVESEEDDTSLDLGIKEENISHNNTRFDNNEELLNKKAKKPYSYVKPVVKEEKKFKPTPVISPVFGILDEHYKADLTMHNLEETKEFNISRKVTFDEIHKKAYGPKLDEESNIIEESNEKDDSKGLFFNLTDETPEDDVENENDIKITYNDVDYEDEDEEEIEVPKISRVKRLKEEKEEHVENEDDILSETKEQDLFNLIDNMYNSDGEEGEE